MALEGLRGFDYEEDITEARGTDVGVTDYLFDIPVGAVAGISQAVKGLLQLGVMPIDYLANTDLLTGIDNIFDKITPETDTAVGDITSILAQFAIPNKNIWPECDSMLFNGVHEGTEEKTYVEIKGHVLIHVVVSPQDE